jgi:ABC-type phosphate/phosphonate transport system ATPase subunit
MPTLNPSIYGKPVPVGRHLNRQWELHTLFSRLRNGECTAVVGESHIGESSLLRCVWGQKVQQEWVGQEAIRWWAPLAHP